ncbi:L-gulonate 5-dehydrogenase [Natranaerovirga hydrolytica]|uniref:L-gulonate 5-dehydrogenase n=1 Tax=Natranaerovirga hydrolytica TaxID=680378 RepID=A0A4R1MJW0_9FIRM|nr:zinc-binding alcohol dehydrogenase family protein [Natranaerovirga hydrolytica]TCK92745.1 L-gulonate 5-dehydrogenase [Natranaerovirga hydrolytica]
MKAVITNKPHELEIIEMEKPIIEEKTDVLIKVKAAGICGSDVHIYHGTNAVATYPRVLGHEIVGEVEEVGENVTKVKKGDRVIIDQVINCGECYACKKGRGNVCKDLKVRGVHVHGGYREYITAKEEMCYILPEQLSYEDSIMIEPSTISVQCLSRAEATKEDTILILGAGALGTSILKVAKNIGAKIIVADVFDSKLEDAKKLGADYTVNITEEDAIAKIRALSDGYGPTVSIDAACTKETLPLLLEVTGNAGRVITMGFSEDTSPVTQLKITAKELDVRGSRLQNKKFQEVIDLVKENKLDLKGSVSHTFHFLELQKALDLIDKKDPLVKKIVLTF